MLLNSMSTASTLKMGIRFFQNAVTYPPEYCTTFQEAIILTVIKVETSWAG
jgi:hypothetical protein